MNSEYEFVFSSDSLFSIDVNRNILAKELEIL